MLENDPRTQSTRHMGSCRRALLGRLVVKSARGVVRLCPLNPTAAVLCANSSLLITCVTQTLKADGDADHLSDFELGG